MQQSRTSFLEWTAKFATEDACLAELARRKWPGEFICPRCGHDREHVLVRRQTRQCLACRHQSSPTAGTVMEHTKLPLAKWFAAVYLAAADKGGISALRLSKMIGVSWPTAQSMLRKLRRAMGDRDRAYWLTELVEVDDALVGRKRHGKRGRGARGKQPVLFAVERKGDRAGFLAAQVVDAVSHERVGEFSRRLGDGLTVRSDAYSGLNILARDHDHQPRPTPPEKADEWLPLVHLLISNFKRFLMGTFHGVSQKRLQEYLDEFVFRFNRRHWEDQLPGRLLEATVTHVPVPLRLKHVWRHGKPKLQRRNTDSKSTLV